MGEAGGQWISCNNWFSYTGIPIFFLICQAICTSKHFIELEISTLITQFLQNYGNESNGQIWLGFSFYYVWIFMNISVLSISKLEAKQKLKATVPPVNNIFSNVPTKGKILPHILVHRMLSIPSNKLILYLLHYQTPCIFENIYHLFILYYLSDGCS